MLIQLLEYLDFLVFFTLQLIVYRLFQKVHTFNASTPEAEAGRFL